MSLIQIPSFSFTIILILFMIIRLSQSENINNLKCDVENAIKVKCVNLNMDKVINILINNYIF